MVALEEIRKYNLDRQLRLDLDTSGWSEVAGKVEAFLDDAESAVIPLGVHTLGVMPRAELQIEALAEFFAARLTRSGVRG